jgi:hypothetical protein
MLEFAGRAETAQRPGMDAALVGLMGASALEPSVMRSWLPDWKLAFESAMESSRVDPRINLARVNYYEKAILAMLEGERPRSALWPLMQTWTLAVEVLPDLATNPWRAACGQLGLTAVGIEERVKALDAFLDEVEILLDELAAQYGLETSTSL